MLLWFIVFLSTKHLFSESIERSLENRETDVKFLRKEKLSLPERQWKDSQRRWLLIGFYSINRSLFPYIVGKGPMCMKEVGNLGIRICCNLKDRGCECLRMWTARHEPCRLGLWRSWEALVNRPCFILYTKTCKLVASVVQICPTGMFSLPPFVSKLF